MESGPNANPAFPETRWSAVLRLAGPGDEVTRQAALEELCSIYWYPLYAFARRKGQSPPDAEDLVQGFFAAILRENFFGAADPEKGRLRTFLLAAFDRHLVDVHRRENARKRGGQCEIIPLDLGGAEERFLAEPGSLSPPEAAFERLWALTMLESSVANLANEYAAANKADQCAALCPFLNLEPDARESYDELCATLKLSKGGARQAVHRFRERFREILRVQVADTLREPTEALVDQELAALRRAIVS